VPASAGLSHVAMSVSEGLLTDAFRTQLLDFYGPLLGWTEIESLRRPDRLTISVGGSSYINIRERSDCMVSHGYEHFGVVMGSAEHLQQLWDELARTDIDVDLEPLVPNATGEGSFRFRFLLPLAVEAQYYAALL
jgi:hypothetical protein